MTVQWPLVIRDGLLLAAGACAIIAGLMRINPRLFLRHFPEPLRSQAAPLSAAERRGGALGALLLFAWVLGTMLASTLVAEARGGAYADLALHAFLVGMAFNLADWLVLDELWLGIGRGRGLIPTEMTHAIPAFDHRKHLLDFLKGSLIFAVLALAVAGAVSLA